MIRALITAAFLFSFSLFAKENSIEKHRLESAQEKISAKKESQKKADNDVRYQSRSRRMYR